MVVREYQHHHQMDNNGRKLECGCQGIPTSSSEGQQREETGMWLSRNTNIIIKGTTTGGNWNEALREYQHHHQRDNNGRKLECGSQGTPTLSSEGQQREETGMWLSGNTNIIIRGITTGGNWNVAVREHQHYHQRDNNGRKLECGCQGIPTSSSEGQHREDTGIWLSGNTNIIIRGTTSGGYWDMAVREYQHHHHQRDNNWHWAAHGWVLTRGGS